MNVVLHRVADRIRVSTNTGRCLLACGVAASAQAAPQGTTECISVTPSGTVGDHASGGPYSIPSMSADGRYIAFGSTSSNLVLGGSTAGSALFVRDRYTAATTRVSVSASGGDPNRTCARPSISADGRYVAFDSSASNLVVGGSAGATVQVFVHDRQSSTTTIVSVSNAGAEAEFPATHASISANGRFVAFQSPANNLVTGDTNGYFYDVFVHDRDTDNDGLYDEGGAISTVLASVKSNGNLSNNGSLNAVLSADGNLVAFWSYATNLVANDTGGYIDVFTHDNTTGVTTRISVSPGGNGGNFHSGRVALSADGKFAAFESDADNLIVGDPPLPRGIFVRDLTLGVTERVSTSSAGVVGNDHSTYPALSADGRFVGFQSAATNLVAGDTLGLKDVFVKDRVTGSLTRVSVGPGGAGPNGHCYTGPDFTSEVSQFISADGLTVVFVSLATNLVAGDTNNAYDVFVNERPPSQPTAYCTAKTNSQGCVPAISSSGIASASSAAAFTVLAQQVLNQKNGLLFYGFAPSYTPFQGGYMCVAPPLARTPVQSSAGNAPPDDCSGAFAYDFNARIQSGVDASLVAGAVVRAQYWYRDPPSASTTGLTNGLVFAIEP